MPFDAFFKAIDAFVKAIAVYFHQLLTVIFTPGQFFAGQDLGSRKILIKSFTFLGTSIAIGYVLAGTVALDTRDDYFDVGRITLIYHVLSVLFFGGLAFLCCRLVGGTGSVHGHITIFSYVTGVGGLILVLSTMLASGVIRKQAPREFEFAIYRNYLDFLLSGRTEVLDQECFSIYDTSATLLILMGGFIAIFAWLIVTWRPVGAWNRLNGRRTSLSLLLFLVLGFSVNELLTLIQIGSGVNPVNPETACEVSTPDDI